MASLRAALYIRVSTLDQAREGYSLAAQENQLRAYCASHGYEAVKLYADNGISAKDIRHRPGMTALLLSLIHIFSSRSFFLRIATLRFLENKYSIICFVRGVLSKSIFW